MLATTSELRSTLGENIFDDDLFDYDYVADCYYSWLYSRLHHFIAKYVINRYNLKKILDIGCGTGFQSYLFAATGAEVTGIDISKRMLEIAYKKKDKDLQNKILLFPEKFNFTKKYNKIVNHLLEDKIKNNSFQDPDFIQADIHNLPFSNNTFSHINSCGSVLNLIGNSNLAVSEIARVLEPKGTFFLDVEAKWNLDRWWTLLDSLLNNKIGYNTSFKDALFPFFHSIDKDIIITYQYGEQNNPIPIKLKLFTFQNLKEIFSSFNLRIIKYWTIHSFTNLIPSVILDTNYPSTFLVTIFRILSFLEEKLPIALPGYNMVFLLQKMQL